MYAIKEAVIAKEHAGDGLDCAVFYMDMRTYGKDFERYYEGAKAQGVRFLRSKVHTIDSIPGSDDIWLVIVGPETPDVGEVRSRGTLYQGQVAATMLQVLGVDWRGLGKEALPPVELRPE